ncbi:MAG: hypothetical protein CFH41_01932 [Alphaproteobacteria bacterium MarineAlpha11_Bin1]|nr:MAG: hypothetical protein CFH41_01932 [Alphaproteobacteria bacterium MarineAlpha11_Bin1]|tara:strand:+ start:2415 stop:2519 length:105 start_codon:yes stop_codon:yes gene_type:complete
MENYEVIGIYAGGVITGIKLKLENASELREELFL